MTRWAVVALALLAAPFLVSCGAGPHFRGEGYYHFYPMPAEENEHSLLERKQVYHWIPEQRLRKTIGFIHRELVRVKGARNARESFTIYNDIDTKPVGFVDINGIFWRFNEVGGLGERVGEYPLYNYEKDYYETLGLKIFYGLDIREQIIVDDIDPYRN